MNWRPGNDAVHALARDSIKRCVTHPPDRSGTARTLAVALALAACSWILALPAHAQTAQFFPLGLPDGSTHSEAYGVSADGGVVVGRAFGAHIRAFRWTPVGGIAPLNNLAGRPISVAWSVSADGGVIAGESETTSGHVEACRWDSSGQIQLLGGLPGLQVSGASAISADGATIVGSSYSGPQEATLWTAGGALGIGDLPGGTLSSHANGANADGSVVVGMGRSANGVEAFRWTSAGMQGLGDLPDGNFYSTAQAVSADGEVVVGWGNGPPGLQTRAFRWTAADGMQSLGVLPGAASSIAFGVSGDGAVIVGESPALGPDPRAMLWTADAGMIDLRERLIELSATGLDGWTLLRATAITADGRRIVGYGLNPSGHREAFLAVLPAAGCPGDVDGDGVVGLADLAQCLSAFGCIEGPCAGDIDGDGDTDLSDLAFLLSNFGIAC